MATLKRGVVVYLDANILIYLTEGTQAQKATLRQRFEVLEAASAQFITSDLAFTEVLVHPIRANDQALLRAYERLMSSLVTPHPLAREVMYLAAKLRAQSPAQRTPDAIHVATAMLARADIFMTGDRGIKNVEPPMALELV